MSTISPLGHQTPNFSTEQVPSAPQTQETTPAPAQQAFTPIWLVQSGGTQPSFEMLGMRMPNAAGDIAAILAQVQLSLEESIGENRKNQAIMSLATLAAALTQFNLEALGKKVDNKAAAITDSEGTLTETRDAIGTLETRRQNETSAISTLRSDISGIRQQLENPKLTDEQRSQLNAQLSQKQGQLNTAFETRQGIDIQLANIRVEGLEKQVDDLKAQLQRVDVGSDEATQLRSQISAKESRLESARSELSTFRNATKTEATRDAFSSSNSAALQADLSEQSTRIATYKVELDGAKETLRAASFLAMAAVAQASATFAAHHASRVQGHADYDLGIEKAFELIAENLGDVQQAALEALKKIDLGRDAAVDAVSNPRVETLALGIVTALSDLVNTLAQLQNDLLPPPTLLPTQANRVRLDI